MSSSPPSPSIFPLSPAVMENKSFSVRSNKHSSSIHTDDVDRPGPRVIEPIDRKAEQRLLRKCDFHVLPPLCILYVLCFIDRINIGNARIQGLEKSLNMKDNDFNIALLVFFPFYILCEVPSNVLIREFAPSTWLTMLMVAWGIITMCTGFTQSFAGLLVCRILLGLCEAGFLPGCLYLISMYYRRYELQKRFTLFFCSTVISGAFGGLFAYAIAKMSGVGDYEGWRWIFIVEGLITIIGALACYFFIVDWPEKAKFLNDQERALLLRRIFEDEAEAIMDRFDKKSAVRVFGDWKIYIGIMMYLGVTNTGYAVSFFSPTILLQLGWTSLKAQYMTIPIYCFAFVCTVCVSFLTDRLQHRYGFAMLGVFSSTIGYVILLLQAHVAVPIRYMAIFFVLAGSTITQPVVLVWLSNNMGGHIKRSASSALQIGFGNCAGIIASCIFITSESPAYPVGYGVSLALIWVSGVACMVFFYGLWRENRKRDKGDRDDRLQLPRDELENLGDDHPRYRFAY